MPGMTANHYRAALGELGLSQGAAADFLGISLRSSNGYANGAPIPEAIAKLLRLMVRLELKPSEVR